METWKVLLATDGSEEAEAACRFLQALPLARGSTIHVLSVINDQPVPEYYAYWTALEQLRQYGREWADKAVREASEILEREGVEVTPVTRSGNPAREILLAADELAVDLVVVGSKGLAGLEGFLIGSVARTVAKRCTCPVLVARAPRAGVRKVLVATDGSERATHAVRFAAKLPLPEGASRTLVHVVRPFKPYPDYFYADPEEHRATVAEARRKQEEQGAGVLADAKKTVTAWGKPAQIELRAGDPASEIVRLADDWEVDLIIAGARGASLIEGILMGSVADRLLKEAHCSVLIVH